MTAPPSWRPFPVPAEPLPLIGVHVPCDARIFDWTLGGTDNYVADRVAGRMLCELAPDMPRVAHESREFLERAVRVLAREHGVRQFLHLGCGLPTPPRRTGPRALDVHTIAQGVDPAAAVVSVDRDPMVRAHARVLLDENDRTAFLHADIAEPDAVLAAPVTTSLLDLDRPTAILLTTVLHCLPEGVDPAALVEHYLSAVPAGSWLVLSQYVCDDDFLRGRITTLMSTATESPWRPCRTRDVDAVLRGVELPTGAVDVATWRPDPDTGSVQAPGDVRAYGALGRR